MERLKHMKETLMSAVQGQLGNLSSADSKELGEAVDMIKDLSEAIYYCTIVKSMEDSDKEKQKQPMMYYTPMPMNYRDMDYEMGRMYYDASARGNNARGGGTRGYDEGRYYSEGGSSGGSNSGNNNSSRNYDGGSRGYVTGYSEPIHIRDYREGQSPLTRKTYMERKMHGGDKATQMQELERYMQELTGDLMEMIEGASADEKQILQKKLSTLATKIV